MSPKEQVILNKKTQINPIWIMRQAGRYLPEFREIRKKNTDFIKLCLNPKGKINISEKIIAASKSNLFSGCNVISVDKLGSKHNFIKSVFLFLISLNSGKYLPACLIIHIGFTWVFLFNITCSIGDI